jgi:serine/threonine protein kinase
MVEREKKILLNLSHPHVVKLKEVIEPADKKKAYMIFEYVPGGELFQYLVCNGPMPEHEARRMFRQVGVSKISVDINLCVRAPHTNSRFLSLV